MRQRISEDPILLPASTRPCPSFGVLLGPDYAGKSSVLSGLLARSHAYCISYDHDLSEDQHFIVRSLRHAFMNQDSASAAFSHELMLSVFHVYMIFLRDRILSCADDKPIIVDSYFYKILSKCVLLRTINEGLFKLWRSLPRPTCVVYLDVDTELAWQRSRAGRNLNRMEYYGREPTRHGFERFQSDLRDLMLNEIVGTETTIIQILSNDGPTAADIGELVVDRCVTGCRRPDRIQASIGAERIPHQ
jgi:thymidylate kinase